MQHVLKHIERIPTVYTKGPIHFDFTTPSTIGYDDMVKASNVFNFTMGDYAKAQYVIEFADMFRSVAKLWLLFFIHILMYIFKKH